MTKHNTPILPCLLLSVLGYFIYSRYGNAVKKADLAFSLGFLAYIYIANVVCFNSNRLQLSQREEQNIPFEPMGQHSLGRGAFIVDPSFMVYFGVSKLLSLLIPPVLIFAAPSDIALMATPCVLTTIAQAVAEESTVTFHDVLRILVPIGYQSYKLFGPETTWALDSWSLLLEKYDGELLPSSNDHYWTTINFVLAWVNLSFTAWNLFGFLLLRVLPVYFDKDETPRVEMAYTLLPLPKRKNKKS